MTLVESLRFNVAWRRPTGSEDTVDDIINRMTPLELAEALSEALADITEEEDDE